MSKRDFTETERAETTVGDKIDIIMDRYLAIGARIDHHTSKEAYDTIRTSLVFCHTMACPLDLDRLIDADDFNLVHDVAGIDRHMCRRTFKLLRGFWPRFASKQ